MLVSLSSPEWAFGFSGRWQIAAGPSFDRCLTFREWAEGRFGADSFHHGGARRFEVESYGVDLAGT